MADGDRARKRRGIQRRLSWQAKAIRLGALAAVASAGLAVAANLSEILGWFAPDETLAVAQEARTRIEDTDAKIDELLALMRNQAAAAGVDFNVESESAIRNAIGAIIASGDAGKQQALAHLDEGDVQAAADLMAKVAANQQSAVAETSAAAAASWREAGALYSSLDLAKAVTSYEEANRLAPDDPSTLDVLGHALIRAGRLDDAALWLEHGLRLDPGPAVESSIYQGLGAIAKQRANYGLATVHLSRALDIAEKHELADEQVPTLISLAQTARAQGDLDTAAHRLERALSVSASIDDVSLKARINTALGLVAASRQDYGEAERLLRLAYDSQKAENDLASQATTLGNLGAVAMLRGDNDSAESILLESVGIGERLGWQSSVAYDLVNLGGIATGRGEFEAAEAYLSRADGIARAVGLSELAPVIVFNRGEVAFERGHIDEACRYWNEAAPLLIEMGSEHAATAAGRLDGSDCGTTAFR